MVGLAWPIMKTKYFRNKSRNTSKIKLFDSSSRTFVLHVHFYGHVSLSRSWSCDNHSSISSSSSRSKQQSNRERKCNSSCGGDKIQSAAMRDTVDFKSVLFERRTSLSDCTAQSVAQSRTVCKFIISKQDESTRSVSVRLSEHNFDATIHVPLSTGSWVVV